MWGCSLKSLYQLAKEKGYAFIGCNSSGNNAYFIRNDKLNGKVQERGLADGFIFSKYRESLDKNGNLTFLSKKDGLNLIKGMDVFNTELKKIEKL